MIRLRSRCPAWLRALTAVKAAPALAEAKPARHERRAPPGALLGLGAHVAGPECEACRADGKVADAPKRSFTVTSPVWLPYVEVADVREATERARVLGATVALEPREGPPAGAASSTFPPAARSPSGNRKR
jgi:hypothetical protein